MFFLTMIYFTFIMFDMGNLVLYDSSHMSKTALIIVCPHCNRRYKWQIQLAGKNITCQCNGAFLMPQSGDPPKDFEVDSDALASLASHGPIENDLVTLPTHRTCHACEAVLESDAVICKHCGVSLDPASRPPNKPMNHRSSLSLKITAVGLFLHGAGALALFSGTANKAVSFCLIHFDSDPIEIVTTITDCANRVAPIMLALGVLFCLFSPRDIAKVSALIALLSLVFAIAYPKLIEQQIFEESPAYETTLLTLIGMGAFLGYLKRMGLFLQRGKFRTRCKLLLFSLPLVILSTGYVFVPVDLRWIWILALVSSALQALFVLLYGWMSWRMSIMTLRFPPT